MFMKMLQEVQLSSGVVYASEIAKAKDVRRMIADCRAQETIRSMTQRILSENEKAAPAGDDFDDSFGKSVNFSIPPIGWNGKEVESVRG